MRVRVARLLSLAMLTASSGCTAQEDQPSIRFEGSISDKNFRLLQQILDTPAYRDARWIEITSAGGDASAGMAIGRLVRSRNLGVKVPKFCVSACAQYIFLAARDREVAQGALVLFHRNMGMIERLHRDSGNAEGAALFRPVKVEEDQFMNEIGAANVLTEWSLKGVEPLCIFSNPFLPATDLKRYGNVSRFSAYAVPRADIEQLTGTPIIGYWPKDRDEMLKALAKLPYKSSFKVNWIEPATLAKNSASATVLPHCPIKVLTGTMRP